MKYLVMENHQSHSVVMDESGQFHRIANLGYEIGDTVTDPIFMKTPEKKQPLNVKKLATIAAIFVCFIMASIPFINNYNQSDVIVYMSINPEIHIEFDKDGTINKLVADNRDGKTLLKDYTYEDKSVSTVLVELIDRARQLKYLSEGGDVRITVETEDGYVAQSVTDDLSSVLKKAYVKKYTIRIRTNQNDFRDINETQAPDMGTDYDGTEDIPEISSEGKYNSLNGGSDPTKPAADDHSDESVQTEATKPVIIPTKPSTTEPTVVTEPSQAPTEPVKPTEPDTEDEDEDDWVWPWAP